MVVPEVCCCGVAVRDDAFDAHVVGLEERVDDFPGNVRRDIMGAICVMRVQNLCEVVLVKRSVLPENIGSHANTTGRNTSHARSGYRMDDDLCNSQVTV